MSDYIEVSDRTIVMSPAAKVFGVFNDLEIMVKHFRIPRHYKDLDLSDFDIRINSRSVRGELSTSAAENLSSDEEYMTFDWTVPNIVFEQPGPVQFSVCARTYGLNGEVKKEWNTTIGVGTVLPGIEPKEDI